MATVTETDQSCFYFVAFISKKIFVNMQISYIINIFKQTHTCYKCSYCKNYIYDWISTQTIQLRVKGHEYLFIYLFVFLEKSFSCNYNKVHTYLSTKREQPGEKQ